MERLIRNLLDMTPPGIRRRCMKKEWQSVQEIIGTALHYEDRRLRGPEVTADIPQDLAMVQMDAVGIEQVLVNLIDNAVEHTPPGTAIDIAACDRDSEVVIEVADHGRGLPESTEIASSRNSSALDQ